MSTSSTQFASLSTFFLGRADFLPEKSVSDFFPFETQQLMELLVWI